MPEDKKISINKIVLFHTKKLWWRLLLLLCVHTPLTYILDGSQNMLAGSAGESYICYFVSGLLAGVYLGRYYCFSLVLVIPLIMEYPIFRSYPGNVDIGIMLNFVILRSYYWLYISPLHGGILFAFVKFAKGYFEQIIKVERITHKVFRIVLHILSYGFAIVLIWVLLWPTSLWIEP
jgi:hypothetical protein